MASQDTGTFDYWVTDRISFQTIAPRVGNTGGFEKWPTDRIYYRDYVERAAPPPADTTEGIIPFALRSRQRMLPLAVFEPLAVGTNLLNDNLATGTESLQVIKTSFGGYWSLTFRINGNQSIVEDWIENGLGRHIELYNPALVKIWEGYVSQVSGNIGSLSLQRGPLLDTVANRVRVIYSGVDTSVTPPAVGTRVVTAVANDTTSQSKYGIIEHVFSVAGTSPANAEQIRDTVLEESREPITDERDNIGSTSQPSITVTCLGYMHWFGAYTYSSTTGGTEDASTKLENVITADPNSIFSTDFDEITTNTSPVRAYEQSYRKGETIIKGITALGDTSFNRYLFGIYNGRKARYEVLPTSTEYQRKLADPAQRLEQYGSGAQVEPWDAESGKWILYTDLLVGRIIPTDRRLDPRFLLTEQVTFSIPWTLTAEGAKINRLDQLLARLGLGGTPA